VAAGRLGSSPLRVAAREGRGERSQTLIDRLDLQTLLAQRDDLLSKGGCLAGRLGRWLVEGGPQAPVQFFCVRQFRPLQEPFGLGPAPVLLDRPPVQPQIPLDLAIVLPGAQAPEDLAYIQHSGCLSAHRGLVLLFRERTSVPGWVGLATQLGLCTMGENDLCTMGENGLRTIRANRLCTMGENDLRTMGER
jgi:hypothetical protein